MWILIFFVRFYDDEIGNHVDPKVFPQIQSLGNDSIWNMYFDGACLKKGNGASILLV